MRAHARAHENTHASTQRHARTYTHTSYGGRHSALPKTHRTQGNGKSTVTTQLHNMASLLSSSDPAQLLSRAEAAEARVAVADTEIAELKAENARLVATQGAVGP